LSYDPQTCNVKLIAQGKHPCPGDWGAGVYHCTDAQESGAIHTFCSTHAMYDPFDWSEVYNKTKCGPNEYDDSATNRCEAQTFGNVDDMLTFLLDHPDFGHRPCSCCCSCYAYGTPIATPQGERSIETFVVGDEVSAASVASSGGKLSFQWSPAVVRFSNGTGPLPPAPHYPTMVFVNFDDGRSLICTNDQLFMLSTGKLKQASRLTLADRLVAADGSEVPILSVSLAEYSGGLHHIATSVNFDGDINGHLLNSNNIVTGDYVLQVHAEQLSPYVYETGPIIGTPEYHSEHSEHALSTAMHAYARPTTMLAGAPAAGQTAGQGAAGSRGDSSAGQPAPMTPAVGGPGPQMPPTLRLYTGRQQHIPDGANFFISHEQAIDILANPKAVKRPFGDHTGTFNVDYIFKLYKAFNPDVVFFLDWEAADPTAYAFEAYGVKHVVVSGGLVRLGGVFLEGMAVIIAQCVASFFKPEGSTHKGLLPRVQADYYGVGLVMRDPWNQNWSSTVEAGIKQVNSFFGLITSDNTGGDDDDPLNNPSIECRQKAMLYASLGGDLPPCAGGAPPKPKLSVDSAHSAAGQGGAPDVIISFTLDLDPATAQDAANYAVTPATQVTSAALEGGDTKSVRLSGAFADDAKYTIKVSGLKSSDGTAIDPDNSTAFIDPAGSAKEE